jgi:hypothetical protein
MKRLFRSLAPAFVVLIFSCLASADDFKSLVIPPGSMDLPTVHENQFMVIRNFTQENGIVHGVVMVSTDGGATWVNVLTAAILTMSPPEVINNIVVAGPADVSVTCGAIGKNCFISFKKDSN